MKKVIFAAFVAAAVMVGFSMTPAQAGDTSANTAKISIQGATCGGCANAIVKAAKQFEGLKEIKIDQAKWVATVDLKDDSKAEELVKYLGENTKFKYKAVN